MSNLDINIDANSNSIKTTSSYDKFLFTNISTINDENKSLLNREDSLKKAKIPHSIQPPGTLLYTVDKNDTIERVALKWNTIPSEVLHINRLSSRMLYPGQQLYVPDPNYVPPAPPSPSLSSPLSPTSPNSINKQDRLSHIKGRNNSTSKPGHIERSNTIATSTAVTKKSSPKQQQQHQQQQQQSSHLRHTLSEDEAKRLDEECMQRFLKLDSNLISYEKKNAIDGVLLITPSALMFDPKIVNNNNNSSSNINRRASSSSPDDNDSIIIPIEIISNVILYEELSIKDVRNYFKKKKKLEEKEKENEIKNQSNLEENNKINGLTLDLAMTQINNSETNNNKLLRNLSQSLTNIPNENNKESTTIDASSSTSLTKLNKDENLNNNSTASSENSVYYKSSNNIKNEEALRRHSINNIPNLFDENDNNLLCYLCIKVNTHKDFISCPMDRKMKNRLQSEFWFQVPDNSYRITDKICAFFLAWKFDPMYAMSNETPKGRFQLVKDDLQNKINKETGSLDDIRTGTRRLLTQSDTFIKDWEIVNLTELESKLKAEEENERLSLPKLIGETKILNEEHLKLLNCNLIARAVSYDWVLTFSTELNGFSLGTVYRQMNEIDSPSLVIVKDTNHNIFGAMTSCKLYQSDHFYGTGESFLFTFYPKFKIFKWTGENNFFIKGSAEYLSIGGGDGANGLWFDGDLYHGHTQKCKTYDNDILTSSEDFVIAAVEIWTFLD